MPLFSHLHLLNCTIYEPGDSGLIPSLNDSIGDLVKVVNSNTFTPASMTWTASASYGYYSQAIAANDIPSGYKVVSAMFASVLRWDNSLVMFPYIYSDAIYLHSNMNSFPSNASFVIRYTLVKTS